MPFDGFFARAVAAELQALEGAKVERVNHNAKEYVELCLYLPGAGRRTLVISVCPSDARIALVDGEESRAAVPTMFCMLLRKHLQSARIRSVCALPNERVLAFELEGFDELGHSETKRIYAEIMGKYSNLFLCDGGDRILGALHTTDITAKTRRIFAGAPYERPPAQDKRDALSADRAGFLALARENEGMPADRFLLTHFLAFSPLTAREVVNTYSYEELRRILFEYGEERYAPAIAKRICQHREQKPIETTLELADIIRSAMPASALREKQHPAKRSFQAIRIAVNDELGELPPMLDAAEKNLKPGGRLAVITFHSLEDRIVKKKLQELAQGCICPPEFPVCVCGRKPKVKLITRKPIVSGEEELAENPRARSAKLRVAEKC